MLQILRGRQQQVKIYGAICGAICLESFVQSTSRMAGWRSVEEIIGFQLSVQLRREVLRVTRCGPVAKDYEFRGQIRDSARSAPRNLSEGFTRYNHGEFAYFANVAKSSLAETRNHLRDGHEESYFSAEDFTRLDRLAEQALKTVSGLIRHLLTSDTPRPYWDTGTTRPNLKRKRRRRT